VTPIRFTSSQPLTIGVELELQILSRVDCDLTRGADDLIALIERRGHPGEVKPEITDSMIEVSTGIHERHATLVAELRAIRDAVVGAADRLNLLVAGGGAHPFQHWRERQIYDRPRFKQLSQLYGYLAKQFTIFGQHVHVGCAEGDSAIYLLHSLSRYIPHFIALAASSPYHQGVDTEFDSARLNSVFAFPLSGRAPLVERWADFSDYFEKMRRYGIVESMKDFYWDIRPKPEYGTIEVRVFDTPLTVEKAAALAAYVQTLGRYLLIERPSAASEDVYHVYNYNRFQACRFGLEGMVIDPATQTHRPIREDVIETVAALGVHAQELEATDAIAQIERWARDGSNDARWMREVYAGSESFEELVWQQSRLWSGRS
jgi:carboxylate-amine ligase